MAKKIQPGQRLRFHYPYFGTPECHPEYRAISGQMVTVMHRDERGDPDSEPLFIIRADDGTMLSANESELGTATFTPHDVAFCGCRKRKNK